MTMWLSDLQHTKAADSGEYLSRLSSGVYSVEPDPSIYENQSRLYENLSWIHSPIIHSAETFASLADPHVYEVSGQGKGKVKTEIDDHEFIQLLDAPNDYQFDNRFELFEAIYGYSRLNGNCYIWENAIETSLPPAELWILRPDRLRPVPDPVQFVAGYTYTINGRRIKPDARVDFERGEIVHLKSFSPLNDWVGLSTLQPLSIPSQLDYHEQQYANNFYSENNAKAPGMLAFSDWIEDGVWKKQERALKEQLGGTRRSLLRMRGVGKGGVQWVTMGLTQADMQYLQSRKFNKETHYEHLSPGLLNILAVNATEANALAGEKTFLNFIWRFMIRLSAKFTARVLPRYLTAEQQARGVRLVFEFADIRPRDRVMLLKEQDSYMQTHTVEETRAEFYQDEPLGDLRDQMFVQEIKTSAKASSGTAVRNESAGTDILPQSRTETAQNNEATKSLRRNGHGNVAAKREERNRFRQFANRRIAEKHPDKILSFAFKHLDVNEQTAILSEYGVHREPREFTRILFLVNSEANPKMNAYTRADAQKIREILNARMSTTLAFVDNPQDIEQVLTRFDARDTLVFNWSEDLADWVHGGETAADAIDGSNFAHTGSAAGVQRLLYDRAQTYLFLKHQDVFVPRFQLVNSLSDLNEWKEYPAFVRHNEMHGSEFVKVCADETEARDFIAAMFNEHKPPALIMEYVSPAREFSVGLISNGKEITVLPINEANFEKLPHDIKDEKDKGVLGPAAEEQNQFAKIDSDLESKLIDGSKRIFRDIGLKIYARVDWRLYENTLDPICIDVNSEPEISEDSLFYEMAKGLGWSYELMIERLLDATLEYYRSSEMQGIQPQKLDATNEHKSLETQFAEAMREFREAMKTNA